MELISIFSLLWIWFVENQITFTNFYVSYSQNLVETTHLCLVNFRNNIIFLHLLDGLWYIWSLNNILRFKNFKYSRSLLDSGLIQIFIKHHSRFFTQKMFKRNVKNKEMNATRKLFWFSNIWCVSLEIIYLKNLINLISSPR